MIYILFVLILWSCDFKSSDYYFSKAEKLAVEGKHTEAIFFYDKAIEKNSKNLYALMNRGVEKSILENYNGAIEDYSKIIKIDSINTLAYLNRGKDKKSIGDFRGAIEDFDRAIKTKGSEDFWMEFPENSFFRTGDEFGAAMEEIRYERGFARYEIDSLRTAFNDFNFCIQRNFELATSYYMVGLIYVAYGNIDAACKALNNAKELGNLNAQEMIEKYCKKNGV